jgi:hypothetical protein
MCEFVRLVTEGLDTRDLKEAKALLVSPGRRGLVSIYRIGQRKRCTTHGHASRN